MLDVLFGNAKKVYIKPEITDYTEISKEYLENYLNYFITINTQDSGPTNTLTYLVSAVIVVFFLKNIFGYIVMK